MSLAAATVTTAYEQRSSLITEHDAYLFREGTHFRLYDKLGAHVVAGADGSEATQFALWAPNATEVSVIGDFNRWDPEAQSLAVRGDGSGIWEGQIPAQLHGERYKYRVRSRCHDYVADKGDPFALCWEVPPKTASIVWHLDYGWGDRYWMETRHKANALDAPMAIYEVHLGSWRRVPEEANRPLYYRELADRLTDYVKTMGFTHVEFLPITEHPFYGSWGYQCTGYFAPTSRYGSPQDFMYLVDQLHQNGIGVILDWVGSHFPNDAHGLAYFDGTYLYEHADPKRGFHPEWGSCIFNYARHEVRAFLISSALFWLDKYHIDALRVDAVASMLYLDYGRKPGEWVPNVLGGREDLDAISFIRTLNDAVYQHHPDAQAIAEESTAWPLVSRPTCLGGLGFGMKWNMGWMHDTLRYFSHDPLFRKYHHGDLNFSIWYAFHENFLLPLSHDEVVYGKGSLLGKMPGDDRQRLANLRLLLGYLYAHPGKKLLFMGGELGQWEEWNHEASLSWHLLERPAHRGIQGWVADLNRFYRLEPALWQLDFHPETFEWIDSSDWEQSVVSFLRKGKGVNDLVLVVCNFTPVPRLNYRIGVPRAGFWREVLNSDAGNYGGSGYGNLGGAEASPLPAHGRYHSLSLILPPLAVLFFRWEAYPPRTRGASGMEGLCV
jgi:1,4-alpha-glucan branching enzyme